MIAVQLNAFRLDDNTIGLHPATVLNVSKETEDADFVDQAERTDRAFRERKADAKSLIVVDQIVSGVLASLQNSAIDVSPSRVENISFGITTSSLTQHAEAVQDTLKNAEVQSRS
jgi:hypothetical protein